MSGCPTGRATSLKASFEDYSRYSLIKWNQFSSIYSMNNTYFISGTCFCCLLVPFKVTRHARVSCLIIGLTINAI